MSKTIHGALVFLVMLCLYPAAYGEPDSKDVQEAELRFSIQMTSALNNDPKAQFLVAEMYEQGAGTPQNLRMAHLWYTKSANQKYAPAIAKLASWGSEKKQTEAAQARAEEQKRRQAEAEAATAAKAAQARAEEQKRRQAEAEAATAAKAAQARAEEQKRRQAEAEAATAAKAAQARAEEQKRRQAEAATAATTAVKAAQVAETAPATKEKQSEINRPKDKSKGTTEKSAEKGDVEFKANPCKTPTAKFTSTCQ
jgi:membrane protein involved in colicin uptake